MSTTNIAATYRGFRLQILYTLFRVLQPDDNRKLIFQPEGQEDLAVLDDKFNLLEVVQVKAYKDNLTLSDFHPGSEDSFFPRVVQQLTAFPNIGIKIVSFGPVGPELRDGLGGAKTKQETLARKLAGHGRVSLIAANKVMTRTNIEDAIAADIERQILDALRQYATGMNPKGAFSMLMYWLYECAENKTRLSRADVLERIHRTGKYLAESQAHHAEWFTTIRPIPDELVAPEQVKELSDTFYRGISACYQHILAGLDVIRHDKLQEITAGFVKSNIVIIHGASGQGKSTLAYRYMHEGFADQWTYLTKMDSD